MATKIKNYFKQAFKDMIDARQRQVNRMISEQMINLRQWD